MFKQFIFFFPPHPSSLLAQDFNPSLPIHVEIILSDEIFLCIDSSINA